MSPMRLFHEAYWIFYKKNALQIQRQIRRLPLSKIKEIQWKRLNNLLQYVYANNEFYRNIFQSLKITPRDIQTPQDFSQLPITDKSVYKSNYETNITRHIKSNEYARSVTSGSSGEPFQFLVDTKREGINMSASYIINEEYLGIDPFKRRNILEIKAAPRNEISNLKDKAYTIRPVSLKKVFQSQIAGISAHKIKSENLLDIVNILEEKQITVINGYSSSILALARMLSERSMVLKMEYIITIGEGLLEHQKNFVSNIFQCPVYRDYIASECLHMGFECKYQNGYHIDLYNYYFEFLKDNRDVSNNEIGEIVVTNLNNYVFPFIRYKIGDSAVVTDCVCQCMNKFPLVRDIYGRTSDTITTPSGKEISSCFISVPFKHMYEIINSYQIIQVAYDQLLVKIVPASEFTQDKIQEIKNAVYEFVDKSMNVSIEIVRDTGPSISGKKKVLITLEEFEKTGGPKPGDGVH